MASTTPDLQPLLDQWGVEATGVEQILGGHGAVFRVHAASGETLALKNRGAVAEARVSRLAFDADVMSHLDARGIAVPVPRTTRKGHLWVEAGGDVFTLSRFLAGGRPPATDDEHREWWENVGRELARLHTALASRPTTDLDANTWREVLACRLEQEVPVVSNKLTGDQCLVFQSTARALASPWRAAVSGLPEQLIHRDAHPGNLITDGARAVGFVDCDHFCVGPRVLDLAHFAVHMVKWAVDDPSATEVWLSRLPVLVVGYQQVSSDLSAGEVAALPYAMLSTVLMFAASGRARGEALQTEVDAFLWLSENLPHVSAAVAASPSAT